MTIPASFRPHGLRAVRLHRSGDRVGWLEAGAWCVSTWSEPEPRRVPCEPFADWWFVGEACLGLDESRQRLLFGEEWRQGPDLTAFLGEGAFVRRVDVALQRVAIHIEDARGHRVVTWTPGEAPVPMEGNGARQLLDGRLRPVVRVEPHPDGGEAYLVYDEVYRRDRLVCRVPEDAGRVELLESLNHRGNQVWLAGHITTDTTALLSSPLDGEGAVVEWLSLDHDLGSVSWDDAAEAVTLVRAAPPGSPWIALSVPASEALHRVQSLVPGELMSIERSRERWVVRVQQPDGSGTVEWVELASGEVRRLGVWQPVVDGAAPMLRTADVEGKRGPLACWLSRPPSAESLVLVVDDPREPGDAGRWHRWLSSLGLAAMTVHMRGTDGYGRRFAARGHGHWPDVVRRDLWASVEQVAAREQLTPIAAVGSGFGGDLALLCDEAPWCRVTAAYEPVLDWVGRGEQGGAPWLGPVESDILRRRLRQASPVDRVPSATCWIGERHKVGGTFFEGLGQALT